MAGDADQSTETLHHIVSIHARAWRATVDGSMFAGLLKFQSTPAHGGRPDSVTLNAQDDGFNPRPRMAGDWVTMWSNPTFSCFNPRPRMAGDCFGGWSTRPKTCFNPRPRMAGDRGKRVRQTSRMCFNPRPRMAGDTYAAICST